jgi:hypothetical protein
VAKKGETTESLILEFHNFVKIYGAPIHKFILLYGVAIHKIVAMGRIKALVFLGLQQNRNKSKSSM